MSKTKQMMVTSYGYNDNDPPSADIAYPRSEGNPTRHDRATEGKGTYDDPITFATSADELAIGTLIYVPHLRKYFIMEDDCVECDSDSSDQQQYHVDLWMGPSHESDGAALSACEDRITRDSAEVIVDPSPDLPVDTAPLFANDTCSAQMH
jgi:hypothetical protein